MAVTNPHEATQSPGSGSDGNGNQNGASPNSNGIATGADEGDDFYTGGGAPQTPPATAPPTTTQPPPTGAIDTGRIDTGGDEGDTYYTGGGTQTPPAPPIATQPAVGDAGDDGKDQPPILQTGRNDVDRNNDGFIDHVVIVQEDGTQRWYEADDRYRDGYATGEYNLVRHRDDGTRIEAQVDDEGRFRSEQTYGASTYDDGTTVSYEDTDQDGRADAMVAIRPDGSAEIIRDTDGDGAPDQVTVETADGLVLVYTPEEWEAEQKRRREYGGSESGGVTAHNAQAAWDAHQPIIERALAVLNDGSTPDQMKAAAAEITRIAAAWRGSGVTADDGGLMAHHLDEMAQALSEAAKTTREYHDRRAAFENAFREVTGREPSGDLAKDAAVLSQYGENPVTDMGYAGDVREFENAFREVTGREPSGDLAKDAAVLSQYGENPVTDMGYAGDVREFENAFREVTGREPSGDLAKDAAVLSQYGENPVTDMGYAGDVREFENAFREVTGREPSGDLAKDAAVLSQYGENPVTDMGYAGDVREFENAFREVTGREPSGDLAKDAAVLSQYGENPLTDAAAHTHTTDSYGRNYSPWLDADGNQVETEAEATYRIEGTGPQAKIVGLRASNEANHEEPSRLADSALTGLSAMYYGDNAPGIQQRSEDIAGGLRYGPHHGKHPSEVLGQSDQHKTAAAMVERNLKGRLIDQFGTIEMPEHNVEVTGQVPTAPGGASPRQQGPHTTVQPMGVPSEWIAWDEHGNPVLKEGGEDHLVPLSTDRRRIQGLNPDGTLDVGKASVWSWVKPGVQVLPGASSMIKLSDIKHPGSAGGSAITGREWRELGSEALVDSVVSHRVALWPNQFGPWHWNGHRARRSAGWRQTGPAHGPSRPFGPDHALGRQPAQGKRHSGQAGYQLG